MCRAAQTLPEADPTALRASNIHLRTGRLWKDPQGQVSSLSPLGCPQGAQGQGWERISGEKSAQFISEAKRVR